LAAGFRLKILELDAIVTALGLLTGGPIDAAKIIAVLGRGIRTHEYDTLADLLDQGNAVMNVFADSVPANAGITVNDEQPYPVYVWLETKWVKPEVVARG
jgi:hypothetical protein